MSLGPITGLRARIVLLMALLTTLMVVLFGFVVIRLLEHHLIQQKRAQGRSILLAMQAHFDLWEDVREHSAGRTTLPPLTMFVQEMAYNLELSSLVIVDEKQNVIGHSRSALLGFVLSEPELARAIQERKLLHRTIGAETDKPEMLFYGPLYQRGKILGGVRFSLPLDDLYAALAGTRRILMLYALMDALVIVLFGSLFLWWALVRPVEAMSAATERMVAGDYRVSLRHRGEDEIGRLSRALHKLATTLQDRDAVNRRQLEKLAKTNLELQQAHDQLLHSDRLAYVGRMAAGVAHEVGNPLGAIYGYLEILHDAESGRESSEIIRRLETEISRIDKIMKELLDFSRLRDEKPDQVDLLRAAGEAVELMRGQRGLDKVRVTIEPAAAPPTVELNSQQFKQTLLNILLNAADAMNGQGAIRIDAERRAFDKSELMEARLPGAPPEEAVPFTDLQARGIVFSDGIGPGPGAPTVHFSITDDGPGMAPEVLGQIFQPFFTTKPPGKGTGLGLAVCHRLVSALGGIIRVESRPGVGTRVTLIYPAVETDGEHE